ncbi:hypothetical protein ACFV0L_07010 [Streptosporangium canum]|uniref:hypothetical protein n=1 Tax=Streptosporangium canum TaxID=324952 RepID=UPI0036A70B88
MIDFWFTSIAWAVHCGLRPAPKATGKHFVNLGPNPNDIKHFEEWRGELLTILAVYNFGHESSDISDVRKIIDLANRYAEVGSPLLLDRLSEYDDFALPRLYLAADVMTAVIEDGSEKYSGRVF